MTGVNISKQIDYTYPRDSQPYKLRPKIPHLTALYATFVPHQTVSSLVGGTIRTKKPPSKLMGTTVREVSLVYLGWFDIALNDYSLWLGTDLNCRARLMGYRINHPYLIGGQWLIVTLEVSRK